MIPIYDHPNNDNFVTYFEPITYLGALASPDGDADAWLVHGNSAGVGRQKAITIKRGYRPGQWSSMCKTFSIKKILRVLKGDHNTIGSTTILKYHARAYEKFLKPYRCPCKC